MKPGYKTSEAWLTFAALLVGAVMSSGLVNHDMTLKVLGMAGSVLAALGYGTQRMMLKSRDMDLRAGLAEKFAKPKSTRAKKKPSTGEP